MTRTIWVTWVTFLVGQVGLICKLNYLDGTRIFTGVKPAYYLKLFWSMWCPEISFSRILWIGPSSVSWRNLWHCFTSDFSLSFYVTFKKKTLTCGSQEGHMWVTSGLLCGSVGQVDQQVWPTFNPESHNAYKSFILYIMATLLLCVSWTLDCMCAVLCLRW